MAIKVQIPVGEHSVTVRSLYQWDYGQVLEIESDDIGSEILEAHFACHNMSEAIVRVCSFTNGIGTVTIPDQCLEQTAPLNVWLCKIDATQRHTIKTIVLPITARTRPCITRDVPADYVDTYGQLIEEVNEAVDAIEKGNVTVANAIHANTAGHATTAESAKSATYATSAGSATTAGSADTAKKADLAKNASHADTAGSAGSATVADEAAFLGIYFLTAQVNLAGGKGQSNINLERNKLYLVTYNNNGLSCDSGLIYLEEGCASFSIPLYLTYLLCTSNGGDTFSIAFADSESGAAGGALTYGVSGVIKFYEIGGIS